MGGVRKKSLSQMHRSQLAKERRKTGQQQKRKTAGRSTVLTEGFFVDVDENRLIKEVSGMKAITPFEIASKFKVKVSVAKDILDKLWRGGYIKPVSGNNRIRVFRFEGLSKQP